MLLSGYKTYNTAIVVDETKTVIHNTADWIFDKTCKVNTERAKGRKASSEKGDVM